MVDTCYPIFSFTMDEFERNLYLYHFNGINPSPRIEMKFKLNSDNPVQGDDFLKISLCCNAVRRKKEFKC